MDAIESLDDGAYSHFGHQVGQFPEIIGFMQPAYYYSSYIGVAALFVIVTLLFIVQGKWRGAMVALVSIALSVALIESIHVLIPRPHPPDADKLLGAEALRGSYPSASVFLFTLCLILLAFALWDCLGLSMRVVYVAIGAALVGWVCMSGFFLALHYVTDVIGGLTGAVLVGWITGRFLAERRNPA
jgi:membrane-associated phospholipid phosphatase